ncbi:hypothetical protein QNM99_06190 [Pseudomonas sp. PCH446]
MTTLPIPSCPTPFTWTNGTGSSVPGFMSTAWTP